MNLGEIRDEVISLVAEPTLDLDLIVDYINEMLLRVAGRQPLPCWKTVGTVTTIVGETKVDLSDIEGGILGVPARVKRVGVSGNVCIYPSLESLFDDYSDMAEVGDVEAVALEGYNLWYQKIPETAQDLMMVYFRTPTLLVDDTDIPSDWPSNFHRRLFVNGTAAMLYNEVIEVDEDTKKVGASTHGREYEAGFADFLVWLGRNKMHMGTSSWRV